MVEIRTRERLTGAAILVAVIVLLVPELLSGPRRSAPQAVAAIDEAPVRSYTLSLGDAQQSAVPAVADGTARNAAAAPAPPAVQPPAVAPVRPVTDNAGSAGIAVPARPVTGRAESAAIVTPARPVSGRAESPPPEAAASAHAAARKIPTRSEGAAHEWAVQVGSFGSRENADRLAHSLKLKGYGAFVTESSSRGRDWYRVRVGPQRDRTAADAIAARLRAAGLRGAVAQPR